MMDKKQKVAVILILSALISLISLSPLAESQTVEFTPPVGNAEAYYDSAENAAKEGLATFLGVQGYTPWAALVINAGNPAGIDVVTVDFVEETETFTIKATDSDPTNYVTILINKAFADKYITDSEGDIEIETSDAVNYEGMDNSNDSAGGGAVYVFQIEHFSTQSIILTTKEAPFPGLPIILMISAVPVAYYAYKKKRE